MSFDKRERTGYRGVERRRLIRVKVDLSTHVVLPAGRFVKCRVTDSLAGWRTHRHSSRIRLARCV
jgi:hypothetical protein